MFRSYITAILFLVPGTLLLAQSVNTINQIHQQLSLLNPAGFGNFTTGKTAFVGYRKQWSGFSNAPEQLTFLMEGSFRQKRVGLGLMVENNQVGMINRTHFGVGYRYRIKFGDRHFLSLGLQAGAERTGIDFSRINAFDPEELQTIQLSQASTIGRSTIGVHYHLAKFELGAAAVVFLGKSLRYQNPVTQSNLVYSKVPYYSFYLRRPIQLNNRWEYTPSLILLSTQGLSVYLDNDHTFRFDNRLEFGLGYRQSNNFYAHAGMNLWSQVKVSYAYQRNVSSYASILTNTHEIGLTFFLGSSDDRNNSTPSNRSMETLQEQIDQSEYRIGEMNRKIDSLNRTLELQNQEIETLRSQQIDKKELDEFIRNSKGASNDSVASPGNLNVSSYEAINVNEENDIQQFTEDPNATYYIVLGVYKNLENAQKLKKALQRDQKIETKLTSIKTAEKTMYFVTLPKEYAQLKKVSKDLLVFRKEKKDQYSGYLNGEPWVLKMKK
jgi:type IX secretion system PorP/SprF family membrane protein